MYLRSTVLPWKVIFFNLTSLGNYYQAHFVLPSKHTSIFICFANKGSYTFSWFKSNQIISIITLKSQRFSLSMLILCSMLNMRINVGRRQRCSGVYVSTCNIVTQTCDDVTHIGPYLVDFTQSLCTMRPKIFF